MDFEWTETEETRQDQVREMAVKTLGKHENELTQLQRRYPDMKTERGMHEKLSKEKVNASRAEVDVAIDCMVPANMLQMEQRTKKWRIFTLTKEQSHRIPGHPQAETRWPGPEREHRQPGTTRRRRKS